MDVQYIPLRSIISDWLDLTGHDGFFNTDLVYKDAQDEINSLVRGEQAKQFITLLTVDNNKTQMPANFKSIGQVAYNIFPEKPVLRSEVSEYTQKVFDGSGCELKVTKECPKCHKERCGCNTNVIEIDTDRMWRTNNPQHYASHLMHYKGYVNMTEYPGDKMCQYHPQFKLMGPASNSFGNLQYHISECINLNLDTDISYTIDLPYLVTNFNKGQVLLSYYGYRVDEKGGMLVPNLPEAIKSITLYIESRSAFRDYRKSRSAEDRRFFADVEALYAVAHNKARAILERPPADKMKMIYANSMRKLLPYWNKSENLNRKQHDQYPALKNGYGIF